MFFNKILKTKNRFRAYPTPQAVQTSGSTAVRLYTESFWREDSGSPQTLSGIREEGGCGWPQARFNRRRAGAERRRMVCIESHAHGREQDERG